MSVFSVINNIPNQLITVGGTPVVWLEGSQKFSQEIVGESEYQRQLHFATSSKPCPNDSPFVTGAWLLPEQDNPYDPTAVSAWIANGIVGYMPHKVAAKWWTLLRALADVNGAACACPAKVFGGDVVQGERRLYGVWLFLPIDIHEFVLRHS